MHVGLVCVVWFRLINYNVHRATTILFSEPLRHCQVFILLIMYSKNRNKSNKPKLNRKNYYMPKS